MQHQSTQQLLSYANNQQYQQLLQKLSQYQSNQQSLLNASLKIKLLQSFTNTIHKLIDTSQQTNQTNQISNTIYQKADQLLDVSHYVFIDDFNVHADIQFLEQLIHLHIRLNQLKYALTIYRQNLTLLKPIPKHKYLSIIRQFLMILCQGRKYQGQVVACIYTLIQNQREILGNNTNTFNITLDKNKNIQNDNQIILYNLRKILISKCVPQLINYTVVDNNQKHRQYIVQFVRCLYYTFPSQQSLLNINDILRIFSKHSIGFSHPNINSFQMYISLSLYQQILSKKTLLTAIVGILIKQLPPTPNHQSTSAVPHQHKYINHLIAIMLRNGLRIQQQGQITNLVIRYSSKQYLTYIQLIRGLSIHIGTLEHKSQLYHQLTTALTQLQYFPLNFKQIIWSTIIKQYTNRQLTNNEYNYKAFVLSHYRKLINLKNILKDHKNILNKITSILIHQIRQLKQKHGNLNYLTHLLTMAYYWIAVYRRNLQSFQKLKQPYQLDYISIYEQISNILKKVKQELAIRIEACKNQIQKNQIRVCIFRIDELQL